MFIILVVCIKIYLLIHYNIEELILNKTNFTWTPYFYIKNSNRLSISFYEQNYEENISNLVEISCKNNSKFIKINRNIIKLDSFKKKYISNNYNKCLLNLNFYRNNLFFNFNNKFNTIVKFKCDLKFLKIKFLVKNFTKFIKISNIQISNDIGKKELNYLFPLVFVDLKQESLNSNKFINKFDVYHGGENGTTGDLDTRLWNEYNKELNGVNWIINNNSQHIKLDNEIIYNIANKVNNTFSIYINLDLIYKFKLKDINNIKNRILPIYSIYSDNLKYLLFNIVLTIFITKNKFKLMFIDNGINYNFFIITLDLNNKNNLERLIKDGIGWKYLIITYIKSDSFKIRIGFKNNSVFYKKSKFESEIINLNSRFNISYKNISHFIGNYIYDKRIVKKKYYDKYLLCYLIIYEYGIFSGSEFDKIEKTDSNVNLILNGNRKLVINNNYNLDRRFSWNNKNKIINCLTNNCILCSKNEVCLYCKKGYFWDINKNCKFNLNNNYFVNNYSDLINIKFVYKDNMFTKIKNDKIININYNILELLNNKNIFFNLKYDDELSMFNKLNINFTGLETKILIEKENNLNFYFQNMKKSNNFLKLIHENPLNNKITLLIGYKNLNSNKDNIIYNNSDCNNLKENSLFFEYLFNSKFKKCYTDIKEGYYPKTIVLLKCPKNCAKCSYDVKNKYTVCQDCLKGYKLINNYCFFNNLFKCNNNKLVDIFDNNNDDKIKICNDFCNICNKKNGLVCYIRNINFNFCDKNNIVVFKSINNKIELKNIVNLDLNNNKIAKCLKGYFISDDGFCEKCNNKCIDCNDSLSCNICKKGYFLRYNNCISCNIKFKNCNICSNDKCKVYKPIKIFKTNNCKLYNDSDCMKCENNYNLINNKCICDLKAKFYLNNLNKCYNCNNCKFCIINGKNNCSVCNKCKTLIKFSIKQNKNEIILFYDSENMQINESPLLLEVYNTKNYIILFRFNKIIIRIFDKIIINTQLLVKKEIIKNLKNGYFKPQILNISGYSLNIKKLKNQIKNTNNLNTNKKYKFIPFKLSYNNFEVTINYTSNFILNSSFLRTFTPIIVLYNLSSLLILWNINYSKNFLDFMDLIKKKHLYYIDNSNFISSKEFKVSYEKIKIKYNNNRLIGEMYFLDLDTILMLGMLIIYNLTKFIKNNENNIILKNFFKYSIYFKLFYFNIIQSNLIKIVYKIIFYSEIFFELNGFLNKWILFFLIKLNILIISHFWFNNYFYCSLFLNPKFNYKLNYKEVKLIKLFVQFKTKETRNYNLIMNSLDLIIVFIFMLLKNFFTFCISILIIINLIKLFYIISINNKHLKISLKFNIISIIMKFNFFFLILIQYYLNLISDITNILIIWFLLINLLEMLRLITSFIIKYYLKYWMAKKKYLINLFKKSTLINLKFSNKKFIEI